MSTRDDLPMTDDLLGRLAVLETELSTLRRELGESTRATSGIPGSDFLALRFLVGDDSYGIPIVSVREIVRYVELTQVTDVPPAVLGAINVRGEIVPVIDARLRLGHASRKPGQGTTIVLTEAGGKRAGLVVDRVVEVVSVTTRSLSEPTGALSSTRCVAAISTAGDGVLQILDLERMLSVRGWTEVESALRDVGEQDADAEEGA